MKMLWSDNPFGGTNKPRWIPPGLLYPSGPLSLHPRLRDLPKLPHLPEKFRQRHLPEENHPPGRPQPRWSVLQEVIVSQADLERGILLDLDAPARSENARRAR